MTLPRESRERLAVTSHDLREHDDAGRLKATQDQRAEFWELRHECRICGAPKGYFCNTSGEPGFHCSRPPIPEDR